MAKKLLFVFLGLLLLAGLVVGYFLFLYTPKPGTFTISKETTHVLGPVHAEGHIDYAEALDALGREGITPENNAHVLFVQALGPKPEGAALSEEYFKRLGLKPLPAAGDYIESLDAFLRKQNSSADGDARHEFERGLYSRPWTAKDRATAAAWLAGNAKPLELVRQGALRPRLYAPLLFSEKAKRYPGLMAILLPTVQPMRGLTNLLCARAMQRLGEGQIAEAREDLLTAFRLGRLVAQGPTLIEALVGYAIDGVTAQATLAWLADPRVSAEEIKKLRDGLDALAPFPPLADKIDRGERMFMLDGLLLVAIRGLGQMEIFAGASGKGTDWSAKFAGFLYSGMDWDPVLKGANAWYDRLASALRIKERGPRQKALQAIDDEIKLLRVSVGGDPLGALSGKRLQRLGDTLQILFTPAAIKVQTAADRAEQQSRNLQVAVALALHQRETGKYPEKLSELAPKFMKSVPADLFGGKELIYQRIGDGYLLYSVGPNDTDDGGKSREEDPKCDDLSVRMPLPTLKAADPR